MNGISHSYITTVLESYEMAERQIRHLARILPDNWELIFVDDGSVPPIGIPPDRPKNFVLIRTGDTRDWTQDIARNRAAGVARGETLLFVDIDHVFTREAIRAADVSQEEVAHFFRKSGILTEDLAIIPEDRPVHPRAPNIYMIRKDLFMSLGGYPDRAVYGQDIAFLNRIVEAVGHPISQNITAPIYVVWDDRMKFHNLKRVF